MEKIMSYIALLRKKQILICCVIAAFVLLTSILYFRYVKPKEFSEFINFSESSIDRCIVDNIDKGNIILEDEKLSEFIEVLNDTLYYNKGKYGNVFKGNIYHIQFINSDDKTKKIVLSMIVSDENIVYIEKYQYETSSKSFTIAEFLSTIY